MKEGSNGKRDEAADRVYDPDNRFAPAYRALHINP
jgi:hypothetical protein